MLLWISNLNLSIASQGTETTIEIITDFVQSDFNGRFTNAVFLRISPNSGKLRIRMLFTEFNSFKCSVFPYFLKLTVITPAFQKGDSTTKHNYRPVSILSNV